MQIQMVLKRFFSAWFASENPEREGKWVVQVLKMVALHREKWNKCRLHSKNREETEKESEIEFENGEVTYVFWAKNGGETRASSMGRRGIGATPFGEEKSLSSFRGKKNKNRGFLFVLFCSFCFFWCLGNGDFVEQIMHFLIWFLVKCLFQALFFLVLEEAFFTTNLHCFSHFHKTPPFFLSFSLLKSLLLLNFVSYSLKTHF